jgi:colanic acid/amylovoran biosynthesis glycosyltransferase
MKLTFVARRYPVHTETFVSEPLEWLRDAGIEVSLVADEPGDVNLQGPPGVSARILSASSRKGTIIRALLDAPLVSVAVLARRRRLRKNGIALPDTLWRALLPEVRSADAIVVHFGPTGAQWLAPAALAGKPLAVYFHGYDVGRMITKRPHRYDQLFRSGAGLLTNSDYQRSRLIAAGAPPANVVVVPLGVNRAFETKSACVRPERLRVVTIGRLVPKKAIDVSVRAFARLRTLHGSWEYHVVGDGPLRGNIEALVRSEGLTGVVHLRGIMSRADTIALLRSASIFVLASRSAEGGDTEGTPVSILEAASLGVPIVATRHAGIPETVPFEATRDGFLVEEDDVDAVASALARLAESENLRSQWGEACRAHVRQRHSADAFVSGLLDAVRAKARIPKIGGTLSPSEGHSGAGGTIDRTRP